MTHPQLQLVVDANLFVHGYTNPDAPNIRARLAEWLTSATVFHAPSLWRFEVTNAIYRSVKVGKISIEDGTESLEELLRLPVTFHDPTDLHAEATAIALRLDAGAAYNAHYLALSERLALPFYTADSKLYNAARHHFPTIQLVPIA